MANKCPVNMTLEAEWLFHLKQNDCFTSFCFNPGNHWSHWPFWRNHRQNVPGLMILHVNFGFEFLSGPVTIHSGDAGKWQQTTAPTLPFAREGKGSTLQWAVLLQQAARDVGCILRIVTSWYFQILVALSSSKTTVSWGDLCLRCHLASVLNHRRKRLLKPCSIIHENHL